MIEGKQGKGREEEQLRAAGKKGGKDMKEGIDERRKKRRKLVKVPEENKKKEGKERG